jgi:hypothetical protein
MTVGIVQHNKWVSTRLVKQIAARTVALQEAVQVTEKQPGNGESVAGAMRSKDDSASTDESDSASEEDTNEDEQSQIDDETESNPASNDDDDTTTNLSQDMVHGNVSTSADSTTISTGNVNVITNSACNVNVNMQSNEISEATVHSHLTTSADSTTTTITASNVNVNMQSNDPTQATVHGNFATSADSITTTSASNVAEKASNVINDVNMETNITSEPTGHGHISTSEVDAIGSGKEMAPANTTGYSQSNPLMSFEKEMLLAEQLYMEKKKAFRLERKRRREGSEPRQRLQLLKMQVKETAELVKEEEKRAKGSLHNPTAAEAAAAEAAGNTTLPPKTNTNGDSKLNAVEKWQRGHQKAHLKAVQEETIKAVTVSTLR